MPHEKILPQLQPAFLEANIAPIAPQQTVATLAPDPEAEIIPQDRPTGRRRDHHWTCVVCFLHLGRVWRERLKEVHLWNSMPREAAPLKVVEGELLPARLALLSRQASTGNGSHEEARAALAFRSYYSNHR